MTAADVEDVAGEGDVGGDGGERAGAPAKSDVQADGAGLAGVEVEETPAGIAQRAPARSTRSR